MKVVRQSLWAKTTEKLLQRTLLKSPPFEKAEEIQPDGQKALRLNDSDSFRGMPAYCVLVLTWAMKMAETVWSHSTLFLPNEGLPYWIICRTPKLDLFHAIQKLQKISVQGEEVMKKLVAVMLLGIALLGTPSAQNLKSDGLQGKVHTLEEETWGLTLKFGEYVKNDLIDKTTSIYDAKGNNTEWAWYNADRSIWEKKIYTYDAKGKMTEAASYNADGSLKDKDIYTYDDKGNKTELASYNADGSLKDKHIFTYDANGNMTERASYNADGSLKDKDIYTYDDKGNKTEWAWYNADGSLEGKRIYTYDSKGNKTEEDYYNADGSLEDKYIYTYDAKGNETEEAYYKADGSLHYKVSFIYEYDKFGNWTKKIISEEVSKFGKVYLEPRKVAIRTITYYP